MPAVPPRARMVGWFDPQVLAQTAALMTTANIFGRHSDSRLIEALASQPQEFFDYSDARGDFWLDYVADVGDGWNSTYSVARAIAQPTLALATANEARIDTHAGRVLIFGGDEVYPYPTRLAYQWRTEWPYATAMAARAERPDVFAVPGNHDWYDSLVAFSRRFCRPEVGFAGCRTRQTRSYFALKLPANWWLVAIDLQLGAELDEPQVKYLQRVGAAMQPEARVILCVPEPQWVFESAYGDRHPYDNEPLALVEHEILRRPVRVFLTGDLHHYRRHENDAGVQKITSGGGGAFLHPTHAPRSGVLAGGFVERQAYPDRATSARLAWRNLAFPWLNPGALMLPAFFYALSAWFASASLAPGDLGTFRDTFVASSNAALRDPVNGLWLLVIVLAFVFFTDTHVRWYRLVAGVAHALAHLFAALALAWLAAILTTRVLGLEFGDLGQLAIAGAIVFLAGGVVGGFILGVYLLVSVQCFGRHANEAFSSLRIEDYKQWLRLRIAPDGALTVFAIGIERVARRWTGDGAPGTRVEPDDPRATAPHLIETVRVERG